VLGQGDHMAGKGGSMAGQVEGWEEWEVEGQKAG
jgi:hypothetical protein